MVVANRTDPEDVGFVQWRVAFYLAGYLNNFLLLLDDFFVYKAKAIAREQPFQVQIFPHTGVEVTVLDDFSYEHVELMEQTATPPLKIFEAQPCIGKRIVVLNVQIEDDNLLSILITGNTWAFRSRLDTFGVSGGLGERKWGANEWGINPNVIMRLFTYLRSRLFPIFAPKTI